MQLKIILVIAFVFFSNASVDAQEAPVTPVASPNLSKADKALPKSELPAQQKEDLEKGIDALVADTLWITAKFAEVEEVLKTTPGAAKATFINVYKQLEERSTPKDDSDFEIRRANFYTDYWVELETVATFARRGLLKQSNCPAIISAMNMAESGQENHNEDGTARYTPEGTAVMRLVNAFCRMKPSSQASSSRTSAE